VSTVLAIPADGGVWFAYDGRMVDENGYATGGVQKVFTKDRVTFGYAGDVRAASLRYMDFTFEGDPAEFMSTEFPARVSDYIDWLGQEWEEFELLVAIDGRLFYYGGNEGYAVEVGAVQGIGSGALVALGSYLSTTWDSVKERLSFAVTIASLIDTQTDNGVRTYFAPATRAVGASQV
jgi:hypothetical protein